MALRTLDSLGPLAGTRVIVRCDFNVPLKDGVITDDGRVRAALPTLTRLLEQGARVVACSHLGRPDGAPNPKYSLAPVAERLGCSEELAGVGVILDKGAGYQRQTTAAREQGNLEAVVDLMVEEMDAGRPL